MLRAGTLMRLTAITVVFGVALLLPVASSCEVAAAAEAVGLDQQSLTLNWSFAEPRCDLMLTGRVTEQGRIRFTAQLACAAAKPTVGRVDAGSARL